MGAIGDIGIEAENLRTVIVHFKKAFCSQSRPYLKRKHLVDAPNASIVSVDWDCSRSKSMDSKPFRWDFHVQDGLVVAAQLETSPPPAFPGSSLKKWLDESKP